MKKLIKISSIIFAFVLTFATAVLFTGCKIDLSMKDGAKAMVEAADNYQKNHEGYDDFADTTLTFNSNFSSEGTQELEYKTSIEAENTVKGKFTSTMSNSSEVIIKTQNVKIGEGDKEENDIHFYINVVEVNKSKTYSTDDDELLKEEVTEKTTTTTYILGTKLEGDEILYYVSSYEKIEEEGKDDIITKNYYQFNDREDYVSSLTQYLFKVNNLVLESYFSGSNQESLVLLSNYTKDGEKVELSLDVTMPNISDGNALLTTMSRKVSIFGKELGSASIKMVSETVSKGSMEMGSTIKVEKNSDAITLSDLTDYTLVEEEIEIEKIPSQSL